MTKEQLEKKLDKLFSNKNYNNFLNHLIRSYFPNSNVSKVTKQPKEGNFVCSLSGVNLLSIDGVVSSTEGEIIESQINEYLNTILNSKGEIKDKDIIPNDKYLGISGKDTNTFISTKSYIIFHNWILSKFLKNDKRIIWLLKNVSKNDYKSKKPTKTKKSNATFKLGDLSVLQELKKKMDNNG